MWQTDILYTLHLGQYEFLNSNKIQGVVVVAQFDRKKTQDLEYHDNAGRIPSNASGKLFKVPTIWSYMKVIP